MELLHYPGQFHGFLNLDSIIGAARDALTRIGTSLTQAFRDSPAVDRSTEISDQTPGPYLLSHKAPAELLTAAILIDRSTRQLSGTIARRLSPEIANMAEIVLRPWWVPAALMRRTLAACVNLPVARQTYPQPS